VVKRASEYLDGLAQERGNDAALSLELATAYKRVGDVQGRPDYPSLGDSAGALASYRKAIAIFEQTAARSALSADASAEMAYCYTDIASLLDLNGDLKGASTSLRSALPTIERLAARHADAVGVRDALASAYRQLADILGNPTHANLGDTKSAIVFYNKAADIHRKLLAEHPGDRSQRLSLAAVYGRLGMTSRAMTDYAGAIAAYQLNVQVEEELEKEDPANTTYRAAAANGNRMLSLLSLDVGNLEDAGKYADQSAALNAQLVKDDPKDMESLEHLANSYFTQGNILAKRKDPLGAQRHFDAALAIYRSLIAKNPAYLPGGLNSTYIYMADMAIGLGDGAKAVDSARKQLEIADRLLAIDASNEFARRNQALAFLQLGKGEEILNKWREARSAYQHSLDIWVDMKKKGTLIPRYAPKLDEAARDVARCDQAIASR
jgi:non-specific serine/threonine protein kinase/serine/threonine-protein kinase